MQADEREFRARIKRLAFDLAEHIDDTPGVIVGMMVANLLSSVSALCGEDVWKEIGRLFTADARMSHGYCQHCSVEMPVEECHKPVCEACEKRALAEIDRLESEM